MIIPQPVRQVHLDFHTSPFIPNVAANFDADMFAQMMESAHVESVNIFAKCHHGMAYYPTKTGVVHPELQKHDLLGEMIEALHRRGIRAPIYTTVVWEETVATNHPEWRQMQSDGSFCQVATSADNQTVVPGRWHFNSFIHPDYQDYFEAHIVELLDNYDVDGFWIDILFLDQGACFNPASIRERERLGLLTDTVENNAKFEALMQQKFCHRFERLIHCKAPKASVFFNSSNRAFVNPKYSWVGRVDHQTHCEIESLPSGFWGYYHFPKYARQAQMWDKPFLGMTGRFQKMWGDFGGIKPQAALEYECFRMQGLGGSCCVGDQMLPVGKLDQGAYHLIGEVYKQIEAAEPFYKETSPCPQGALLLAGNPGQDEVMTGQSEEGAVMMLEELHYDIAVIDSSDLLDAYSFVVLVDSTPIDKSLYEKLRTYYANGGKLIITHRAGFDIENQWALDFLPLQLGHAQPLFPAYWKTEPGINADHANDFRVIYQQGQTVQGNEQTETLVQRYLPYFKRSDLKYCSHFQTPADPNSTPESAVIAGENFVYFADPIFSEYRQAGNTFIRDIFASILSQRVAKPYIVDGLDPHIHAYARRSENDLKITLINYLPCRKALAVDVIERALSFAGQNIRFDREVLELHVENMEILKPAEGGAFTLPATLKGRMLITVPKFFEQSGN